MLINVNRQLEIRQPTCHYNLKIFERQASQYFSRSTPLDVGLWRSYIFYVRMKSRWRLRLRQTARTDFGFRRIHRTRTNIGFPSKASSPRILWKYFLLLLGDFLFNARSVFFSLPLFRLLFLFLSPRSPPLIALPYVDIYISIRRTVRRRLRRFFYHLRGVSSSGCLPSPLPMLLGNWKLVSLNEREGNFAANLRYITKSFVLIVYFISLTQIKVNAVGIFCYTSSEC